MNLNMTVGNEKTVMIKFALPMMLGNALQQFYNIADTWVVGQFIGANALAAVGISFTLMVFLTSVIIGLCMGSGVVFSMLYGAQDEDNLKNSFFVSFLIISGVTVLINLLVYCMIDILLKLLQVDLTIIERTKEYLLIIFAGIPFIMLYNFSAALLRSLGNSTVPVICIVISSLLNVGLDLLFILVYDMDVAGAAWATVISQAVSAILILLYLYYKVPIVRIGKKNMKFNRILAKQILQYASLTSIQQSIMNFGILMIQGLVNSFGVSVTAAFAAAVKIDAFAYMPVQDFGNAFSTYIAQNHGAQKKERIHTGTKAAIQIVTAFSLIISFLVFVFAHNLMEIFIHKDEIDIIKIGVQYLRIEGTFYIGISYLFLLYGFYRGIGKAGISVILTIISLGSRVLLAYVLAPIEWIGLSGIWWAIPIGWLLADLVGFLYYRNIK